MPYEVQVPASEKPIILDFSRSELEREVVDVLGQSRFRARQIWQALHRECISDFEAVTTLPKALRSELAERYAADPLAKVMHLKSKDGSTDKALFRLGDGELVETVLMRYSADGHRKARKTVCVSTQAGCALGCTFCATGQQGFRRHLTTGEIIAQITFMQRIAMEEDRSEVADGERERGSVQGVTNVVFMGMGEPLANYDNTMSAIRAINDPHGLAVGARHITLSTVGLAPQIVRLARRRVANQLGGIPACTRRRDALTDNAGQPSISHLGAFGCVSALRGTDGSPDLLRVCAPQGTERSFEPCAQVGQTSVGNVVSR